LLWLSAAALIASGCQTTTGSEPAPEPMTQQAPPEPAARPASSGDSETLTFAPGSDRLDAAQLTKLQVFARKIAPDPSLRLHVVGSSGSSSEEQSDKWLAEQRAKNVASYLTSQGIAPRNVTLEGHADATGVGDGAEVVVSVR
jgi:outer membrane protein OmpA-like peptidoglycan-associated protein